MWWRSIVRRCWARVRKSGPAIGLWLLTWTSWLVASEYGPAVVREVVCHRYGICR